MALRDAMDVRVGSPRRVDLAANHESLTLPFPKAVARLCELLGARLVSYITSVNETRAVHEWAHGDREPRGADTARRIRLALHIALLVSSADDREVAQAWFQGLNPQLDDVSPARLLREGDVDTVGPDVLAAARAFLVGG